MIFKSKYELYEFHLAPSPWSICRFQKKNKWANRLPRGQKRELGVLGIDRAMFTLILASVFVITGLSNLILKIKFPQS